MVGQRVKNIFLRSAALSACIVLVATAVLIAIVGLTPLPNDLLHPQDGTTTLLDCRNHELTLLASTEARAQYPLVLQEMGPLPAVTVALEDAHFYRHWGVDIRATFAALVRNIRAGRIVSGGSTITQQLIKLSSRRMQRSWTGKIYENLAALRLEFTWSKDRILEEYLNRSHYGNRHVGPAAAARAYFGKTPKNLTLPEAVYLAGLPQAPTRFNPWRHAKRAEQKYCRSVARLERSMFFGSREGRSISAVPHVLSRLAEKRPAPHFVDAVLYRHPKLPGGVVATTLDLDLQRIAEKELELQLAKLAPRRVQQGAVIILDTDTGSVRAMVGSRAYSNSQEGQINGATIHRSCGSTLKPFVYLRAIEDRVITAATLLPDTPDAVRARYIDYDPVNYDNTFLGPTRVREALASSLNVPAVVTLSRIGARKGFIALQDCGFHFARPFSEYGAGLVLGNAEVRLVDMTAAFTVFSGKGLAVEPRLLSRENSRHRFVASREAVSIVADILADNDARFHTFGPFSPLAFENQRIPCKTGTSSGFRDGWAVGVTAQHAVGVWVGNFDGSPMEEVAAITGAAPVWRAIIDELLQRGDTSVPEPVENARLRRRKICALTGLLPAVESPRLIDEWFLTGTEPSEEASRYWQLVDGRRKLVLPPEYALWCRTGQNRLGAEVDRRAPLRIISPHPNAKFLIDPHLPRPQQALQLMASSDPAERLVWRVDGKAVQLSANGYFWPLVEGQHTLDVFGSGRYATTTFDVQ